MRLKDYFAKFSEKVSVEKRYIKTYGITKKEVKLEGWGNEKGTFEWSCAASTSAWILLCLNQAF